jgi:hypothetical protein
VLRGAASAAHHPLRTHCSCSSLCSIWQLMLWRRQLCSLRRVRALHQPPVAGGRHARAQTRQVVLSGARSPCRMTFSLPRQYETGLPVLPRGTCYTPASFVSLNCAQDLFTSTRSSTTLPCGHNVHVHCFNQYARAQPWTRCPLCRKTSMYATTPPPGHLLLLTPCVNMSQNQVRAMSAYIDQEIARCACVCAAACS